MPSFSVSMDLRAIVLTIISLSALTFSNDTKAQFQLEGNFDFVPRIESEEINRSMEFRPMLGFGWGMGKGALRFGALLKAGASFLSVGNESKDYNVLKAIRGGSELYLRLADWSTSPTDNRVALLAIEQNYNLYRNQENYWETSVKAGIGSRMLIGSGNVPLYLEAGPKFNISYLSTETHKGFGLFVQVSLSKANSN